MSGNVSMTSVKLCAVVTVTSLSLYYMIRRYRFKRNLVKKIQWKQAQCKAAFEKIEEDLKAAKLSDDDVMKIVDLPFLELQQQLQDGRLKAVDVLHAYQSFALQVNSRINCITEPLLDAEEIAQALDAQIGKKGPLHGIPLSLKESFDIKGLDTTAGLVQFIGDIKTDDAILVKILKEQGAVPFVRTNVPQTLMIFECSNPIFGQTKNPFNSLRGPGGSTGGEAAILGARASMIGFGTDIGGSIRVPSHMSGCYGLKTTLERFSRKGHVSLLRGQNQVSGTAGPMARDLNGLVALTKATLCDHHFYLDPKIAPLKFRDEIYESTKPLRIGFYTDDGCVVPAVPACERAVLMAKQALESRGHTVVAFKPPNVRYAIVNLYIKSVSGDGGKTFTSKLENDISNEDISKLMFISRLPKWVSWILSWIIQVATKDQYMGEIVRARLGIKSVYEWFQNAVKLQEYKDDFLAAWRHQDLDALICPTFATTAVPHGKILEVINGGSYSMLYNTLNYPAGSIPVTRVTRDDVTNTTQSYPNKTAMQKAIKKYTIGSEGLPVGVQCVSLPFQEETVLRVMKEIDTVLSNQRT